MRIRSTKPEFWTSKTIAALPWDVRLVLKGLESYVDDNGVGKDDIALIASDVFPRDLVASPRDTLARLTEAVSLLETRGLIARYQVDGEELLYIDRWAELQRIDRPGKGRFPRPDGTYDYKEAVNRETYRKPRETVASPPVIDTTGAVEQGNRGAGDQGSSAYGGSGQPSAQLALVADAPTAQTLVGEWIDNCRVRPPDRVIGQTSKELKNLIDEGTDPGLLRHALAEWNRRGLHPSALASVVHQVANSSSTPRRGDIDWDAAFARAAAKTEGGPA